jgi:hypothetical protein
VSTRAERLSQVGPRDARRRLRAIEEQIEAFRKGRMDALNPTDVSDLGALLSGSFEVAPGEARKVDARTLLRAAAATITVRMLRAKEREEPERHEG